MKRVLSILLVILTLSAAAQNRQAAYITRIIAKMPAKNQQQLDSCMQQISGIGGQGLTTMALLLGTYQGVNKTRLQYALAGYAAYVTTAGKEETRTIAIKSYCTALKQLSRVDDKAFLITQLQRFADNSAVPVLKSYLLHNELGEAATAALVQINTPDAIVALLKALDNAKGKSEISLINGLGKTRYLSALDAITRRTTSPDPRIKKAAFYALANTGNADSDSLLAAAAQKAGYHYETTGATGAYLLFIQRLANNWPTAPAITAASKLLKQCNADELVHVRIAALKVIADIKGVEASPILMREVDDNNPAYRAAVLEMAGRIMNTGTIDQWINKAREVHGEKKAGIISMLGNTRQRSCIMLLNEALKDGSQEVRLAAIRTAALLETSEMMPGLMVAMKTADTTEMRAIAETLQHFRGADMSDRIASVMLQQPPFAQVLLLHILEKRKATGQVHQVSALLKSKDPEVVQAATATLQAIQEQ